LAEPKPETADSLREREPARTQDGALAGRELQAALPCTDSTLLQSAIGNRATQRLLTSTVLQPKLTIGAPDDVYENEADAVAEQVVSTQTVIAASGAGSDGAGSDDGGQQRRMSGVGANQNLARQMLLRRIPIRRLQQTLGNRALARLLQETHPAKETLPAPATPELRRKCECGGDFEAECAECRADRLAGQREAISAEAGSEAPPIVDEVLRTPGQPLANIARKTLEPSFGHDFGQVRVHNDSKAAESALAVNALAYTVGSHIVFGAGRYAPGTDGGNRLLAHELTHVIQQAGSAPIGGPLQFSFGLGARLQGPLGRCVIQRDGGSDPGASGQGSAPATSPDPAPASPAAPGVTPATALPSGVDLKGASLSFDLPGDKALSSSTKVDVVTTDSTTVTLAVTASSLQVSFSPPILIKPLLLQNMQWSGLNYNFATASTSVALTGGMTSPESQARQTISESFLQLISGTPLAAPGYNPINDADLAGTLRQIKTNFDKTPSKGGEGVKAADVTNLVVAADVGLGAPIASGGLIISKGVHIAAKVRGSAASLGETGPIVDSLTISGDSIIVQSDGVDVAQIHDLTVARGGAVTLGNVTLLGPAKELAQSEEGIKLLLLIGLLSQGSYNDRPALASIDPDVRAEIVPGLTRLKIQDALTKAVRSLVVQNADAIPGYDLSTVFGVARPGDFPLGGGPNRQA
jgi:hypothetical protein